MKIGEEQLPQGAMVFHLQGHLDEHTTATVVSAVRQALDRGQSQLVLDLSGVAYVTSSGFAALMALYGRARSMGGDVVVLHAPANIEVMLTVLQLTDVRVTDELSAALDHFATIPRAARPTDGGDSEDMLPHV